MNITARDRLKKLLEGKTLRLQHKEITGGRVPVHLTVAQHKKIRGNHRKGMGAIIKLTPRQIRHTLRHGAGFWGKLWSGIKTVGKAIGPTLIKEGIPFVAKRLLGGGLKTGPKVPCSQHGRRRRVTIPTASKKLAIGRSYVTTDLTSVGHPTRSVCPGSCMGAAGRAGRRRRRRLGHTRRGKGFLPPGY